MSLPPLLKGCISPLLRNKQVRGQQEWAVGSTFQAAPLSNHKCHHPLPSVQPGQHLTQVPSIQASPRSPGRGLTGYTAGCLTSSHFLFGFKEQNRGVKQQPLEPCSLPMHPRQSRGAPHKPRFAAPLLRQNAEWMLQPRSPWRVCVPMHPNPWGTCQSLGTRGWFTSECM